MLRLFYKESRQLLPIGGLWIAVLILNYVVQFSTERIDEESFSSWCDGYCDYNASAVVIVFTALIALVTAYSLFPREHDDATIDFLRALPISNRSIFLAKVLAAWLLLCLINVLSYGIDALVLSINPESIGGRFYPQVWTTLLWRDCLVAFILLSHGVLLSWFRTIGLVIYAVYLLLLMWAESELGTSGDWSIFTLLANEYDGSRLIVNSRALTIHSAVALCSLFVAYLLWTRTESSVSGGKTRTRTMTAFRVFLSICGFSTLAAILLYRVSVGTGNTVSQDLNVVASEHYRFVYPSARESTMQYMLQHADNDFKALADLLGVTDLPDIRVDMSAQSEHAAGLATWKKIQMDLDAFEADVSQRRVLSHETTHVLQAVESNRALARHFPATRFFIEGMAQYTSFEIVPEEDRRDSNWQLAAIAWSRQNIEFNDLIDEVQFSERFDTELHYSLGDLWTRAFVTTCGESALGDFLRAAGREDAVREMPAAIFWRDTTGYMNCDLDTINEQWRTQMGELLATIDQSLFPIFSDIVVSLDSELNQIVINATLKPYEPTDSESSDTGNGAISDADPELQVPPRFIVRVAASSARLAAGVDPTYRGQLLTTDGQTAVRFTIPAAAISGTRFRYQLGYSPQSNSRYYYQEWKRGSL